MDTQENLFQFKRGRFLAPPSKKNLIAFFFDVIGFLFSLVLVFMGYSYGRQNTFKSLIVTKARPQQTVTYDFNLASTPTPVQGINSRCIGGFSEFNGPSFSVCIPEYFSQTSYKANTYYQFVNGEEELLLEPASTRQWPIHLCNFNQDIVVGTLSGVRTTFRQETGAGCDSVTGYASKINTGSSLFYIGLRQKNAIYETNAEFETIEQSLILK